MDIKTLKAIVPNLPPEIAVLMRGPTGVGKSHVAKTFADVLQLADVSWPAIGSKASDSGLGKFLESGAILGRGTLHEVLG